VGAEILIRVGMRHVQKLDQDVLERFALGLGARTRRQRSDSVSAARMASMTACLLSRNQSDETLVRLAFGVDAKVAEEDLERDAAPPGERDGFSAGHVRPIALRAAISCCASH
jgi:hypothetical protein